MGIIEKQATRNAIYSYLGAGLGFITILWQSHLFSTDENGLLRILVSVSMLFAQFSNLGFSTVTIKFFPFFKNKDKGHHGFLFYSLIVSVIGFALCYLGFYLFEDAIIADNLQKSKLFVDYLYYVMPLTFFTLFFFVFDAYLRATFSSVIGSFTKDLMQRIFILIAIAAYFFKLINFPIFIFWYITSTCLPTLILLFEIIRIKEWHIKPVKGFIDRKLSMEMMSLAVFSIFSTFSAAIILSIDVIMVNHKLGLSETGIYSIAFYFGSMITIPSRAIGRISSTMVAESFKKNDIDEIASIYKKSSNSLMMIGLLLFICVAINIDDVMKLLPVNFISGKSVILIVSAGYVVELSTGINQLIIINSRYYIYDTALALITVCLTVMLNNYLIPVYGIKGSAIATAATVIFVNILRYGFILWKYNIQPFDLNSFKVIVIAGFSATVGWFIPATHYFIIDILIKSSVIGGLFVLLMLKWEATPELNIKIRKNLKRFSISI